MQKHFSDSARADRIITIRPAHPGDASALAALLKQLGTNDPLVDRAKLAKHLAPRSNRAVLVAEQDGMLLGTCTLHLIEHLAHGFARSAVLEDMVVDSPQRGKGIGKALLRQAIELARSRSCYKLALSSALQRDAAHRFYQEMHFTQHGVSLALTPLEPL